MSNSFVLEFLHFITRYKTSVALPSVYEPLFLMGP